MPLMKQVKALNEEKRESLSILILTECEKQSEVKLQEK